MGKGNRHIDPSVREEYLQWLLTPPTEREPAQKREMAEHLGVSEPTLFRWEKSEEFQEALRNVKQQWGAAFQVDILSRLIDIIHSGTDTAAIQAAKVLLPHIDAGPKETAEDELSEAHLAAIRKALEEEGYEVINK
jgi:DNA-binding XRE family transcriptional regulator